MSRDPFGVPLGVRMLNQKLRRIYPLWGLLTGNDVKVIVHFVDIG
jgi:hypothetical protein